MLSGIAKYYSPQQLIGKTIVLVANLQPVKIRGIMSEGMILAAEDDNGNLSVITCDKETAAGSKVR